MLRSHLNEVPWMDVVGSQSKARLAQVRYTSYYIVTYCLPGGIKKACVMCDDHHLDTS